MQAVEREAANLARQFHAAPPQQQALVATPLVKLWSRQPPGIKWQEWQDAGGRAGVVAVLAQTAKSSNAALQQQAVIVLGRLVGFHHDNQSAAAAAGAVPHLTQLTKSSNADLQQQAVIALGFLVNEHHDNQSAAAAAGAVPHLMQLTKSSNAFLQEDAVIALGCLVLNHHDNQSAASAAGAVECMCNLLSTDYVELAFAAAHVLYHVSSLADNARRAVSMGAVALLLQLKARSGGLEYTRSGGLEYIDQVLAKFAQVATAPPPTPSSEPAFAAAAPAPVPAPDRRLAPGSRVRIEGLQGRPEMNGRTGIICGALQQASMLRSC